MDSGKADKMRNYILHPPATIVAVVLVVLPIVLYAPSLGYEFTLDDPLVTVLHEDMATFDGNYSAFFQKSLYSSTTMAAGNENLYRPVLLVSLALNYEIAGRSFDPKAFHLFNILLYALCVFMAYLVAQELFRNKVHNAHLAALLSALLFMTLPAHLEVVCNIKHREEMLSFLFSMLSWFILLRLPSSQSLKRYGGIASATFLFFLALMSKESAVLCFPVFLLALYFRNEEQGEDLKSTSPIVLAFLGVVIAYALLRHNALGAFLSPADSRIFFRADEDLLTRMLVSAGVFVKYYLWDQFVILELNPAFSNRFTLGMSGNPAPWAFVALLSLVVTFVGSLVLYLKKKHLYAFMTIGFFITSFMATNIIPIGTAGAFRLMYTPGYFLCLLAGALIVSTGDRAFVWGMKRQNALITVLGITVLLVLIYYGSSVLSKQHVWKNDGTLFEYAARIDPDNPLSAYAAGQYYGTHNLPDLKYQYYRRALTVFMDKHESMNLFDERAYDAYSVAATEIAYRDLREDPQRSVALANIAIGLFGTLERLRHGKTDSNIAGPYYVKALALRQSGRIEESKKTCRQGLAITPHTGLENLLRQLEDQR